MPQTTYHGEELGRFSINGKTVFFNRREAKNGSPYLSINALYGQGQREQLVLFKEHMLPFWDKYISAFRDFHGFIPVDTAGDFERCPDCGSSASEWRVKTTKTGEHWMIFCRECLEIIFENAEDVSQMIKEEENE